MAHPERHLLVRALLAGLLLARVCSCLDDVDLEVPEQAAPAVVASPLSLSTASDQDVGNETVEELEDPDRGTRAGRFLSWPSSGSPHPTMATFSHRASQLSDILRRAAKFLSAFASSQEEDAANNEIDVDSAERKDDQDTDRVQDDESPSAALSGLYSECLLRLSVPCVQRKLLLFLDRLGRMERFRLFGDFLTVVRVEPRGWEGRRYILDESEDVTDLAGMVDRLVDDFFDTHVLRFTLPGTLRVGRSPKTTVDIHLERPPLADESSTQVGVVEGRGFGEARGSIGGLSGGGSSKKKQKMLKKIKKKVMKLLMMLMSVMMVMGPMMGGMAGNQAGMATMMGLLALIILKALIIKQLGGSVSSIFGNVGSSFGNLAGIPNQQQSNSYQPSWSGGGGGGPYARSDYLAAAPYSSYAAITARSFGDAWLGGFDPMALAYRAYALATHLK